MTKLVKNNKNTIMPVLTSIFYLPIIFLNIHIGYSKLKKYRSGLILKYKEYIFVKKTSMSH